MLVLRSTYNSLHVEHCLLQMKYDKLLAQWNELVGQINAKGGRDFLDGSGFPRLSKDDITRLLQLCHPDKHGGKPQAVDMTQKLLRLREAL